MGEIILTNAQGKDLREMSHSQYDLYSTCAKKYEWSYVDGWKVKGDFATAEFGKAIELAIVRHFKEGIDPVEAFETAWLALKGRNLVYPKKDTFESLMEKGLELMTNFLNRREEFPIVNPTFYDWKGRILYEHEGHTYASIPDMIAEDHDGNKYVCDIKALGKKISTNTPGIVALDQQLRTQAASAGIYNVVLWVFVRSSDADIQWLQAKITKEHAEEAIKEEMAIIPRIKNGEFPMSAGIRWPNSSCMTCPYRGLCLEKINGENPEYSKITRDELVRLDYKMLDNLEDLW